jgi:hypothetical protein
MKITLTIPNPDWLHVTQKRFNFSADAIKALLHSSRNFIKILPKKFGVDSDLNVHDPKSNQTYRFVMNQEWLDACKALDDYPENYASLQKQLTNLDKIKELCEEAFDQYQSRYFSGGAERVEAITEIRTFLQRMREKEEKDSLKTVKAVLGCLISARDKATEQHTSQLTYYLHLFSGTKPKFTLDLEPVINVYKALLDVPHEKEFCDEYGRQAPPESKKATPRAVA